MEREKYIVIGSGIFEGEDRHDTLTWYYKDLDVAKRGVIAIANQNPKVKVYLTQIIGEAVEIPPTPQPRKYRLELFDGLNGEADFMAAWIRLAKEGKCDTAGGAEYTRIFESWKEARIRELIRSQDVEAFILIALTSHPSSR